MNYITKKDILVNMAMKEGVLIKSKKPELCFFIIGFLRLSNELSEQLLSKVFKRFYPNRKKVSVYYIRKEKELLLSENLIFQSGNSRYKDKIANKYKFTDKFKSLELLDTRFYRSWYDMRNHKNVVNIGNSKYLEKYSNKIIRPEVFHEEWNSILDEDHAKEFIPALEQMEQNNFIFDLDNIIINYSSLFQKIKPKELLKRKKMNIKYYPTNTGRLQSKPSIYNINKTLRKNILPIEDRTLKNGSMFSLDYSANELRLLASYIDSPLLTRLLNKENESIWTQIIKILDPPSQYARKDIIKHVMLSTMYGSNGKGSLENTIKIFKNDEKYIPFTPTEVDKVIKELLHKIHNLFPGIKNYMDVLITEYKKNSELHLVDGIYFDWKRDEKTGRHKPLKHTILSNKNQALGAAILRRIIIMSSKLKYCKVLYPVHDEVIFYCFDKKNHQLAINEARQLMMDVGSEVLGNKIPMLVDLEWERM